MHPLVYPEMAFQVLSVCPEKDLDKVVPFFMCSVR